MSREPTQHSQPTRGRTVTLDPGQLATLGITEPVTIVVPVDWDTMTRAGRRAWCHAQIELDVSDLLHELTL